MKKTAKFSSTVFCLAFGCLALFGSSLQADNDDTKLAADDAIGSPNMSASATNIIDHLASSVPRAGNLMPNASLVGAFADPQGNNHPMSVAWDGTNYWVVGGGSTGDGAKLDITFSTVSTAFLSLSCRSVFYNPTDGEVYIKDNTTNSLMRLHRSPFDGTYDTVFTNIFQSGQSDVCISSDGTTLFDVLNGKVIMYNASTGVKVDSLNLDMQHPTNTPLGYQLAHTGTYLITFDSSKVFAYSPVDGSYVGSCSLPNGPYYSFGPSYSNGYYFIPTAAEDSIHIYQIDDGVTSVRELETLLLPKNVKLRQNYPNPFNPTTEIRFSIAEPGEVELSVFNIMGQKVRQLVDRHMPAGEFVATWDGRSDNGLAVASGIYFYRLSVDDFTETKKMIMLK